MEPLSLKSVVLCIACGVLLFIIVFIFAKRQITRFTLKSRRGPHAEIGEDAPKALKEEIHARLKRVVDITYEPPLISVELQLTTQLLFIEEKNHYWYRMKAMDKVKALDEAFKSTHGLVRRPGELVSSFLRTQGPLCEVPSQLVEKFILMYNHARYGHADFRRKHYFEFTALIEKMIEHVHGAPVRSVVKETDTCAAGVTHRGRKSKPSNTPSQQLMLAPSASVSVSASKISSDNLQQFCKDTNITGSVV